VVKTMSMSLDITFPKKHLRRRLKNNEKDSPASKVTMTVTLIGRGLTKWKLKLTKQMK
jgi:hypothetical protein